MATSLPVVFGAVVAGAVVLEYGIRQVKQGLASVQSVTAPTSSSSSSSSPSSSTATAPTSSSESAWISALLKAMGAPTTQSNINSLSAWIRRETPWPPVASNNPLNTTLSAPGATDYNSVGVKNFPSAVEGITATLKTLASYPCILAALKSGNGLCGQCASDFSKWSGGGYSSVC